MGIKRAVAATAPAAALALLILAVMASVWAQSPPPNPTMRPADAESITLTILPGVQVQVFPGVHSVITAKAIGNRVPLVPMRLQPLPDFEPFGQPVIAETKVRYVGEAIALVLADSPGLAEERGRHRSLATRVLRACVLVRVVQVDWQGLVGEQIRGE